MFDSYLLDSFATTFLSGSVGCLVGAGISLFGGEPKVPLGKSTGIGFLVGAGFGATFAIFRNMMT